MLTQIAMFIWYLLCPSYRRKIDAEAGWHKLCGAARHLLFKDAATRADIEAARIINSKMRELLIAMKA